MRLLDAAGRRRRLASGLGGQLLAGRLASGGFTGGLSAEGRTHNNSSGAKHTAEELQVELGQQVVFRINTDSFSPPSCFNALYKYTRSSSFGAR